MIKKILSGLALIAAVVSLQSTVAHADTTDFWGFKVNGWQKYSEPVLPRQPGQWDSALTREIAPIINDSDGKLTRGAGGQLAAYYFGADTNDVRQIGKATSTDNGYTWTNRAVAIAPSGVTGSWYQSDVWQPTVIKRTSDNTLLMLATGQQNDDYTTSKIGAFTSSDDGTTWVDQGVQVTMDMFHYENGNPITEFGVPRVIKRSSGDYLLVLEGQTYGSNQWRIFAATSSTFTGGWTALNNGNPIMLPGSATWEDVGVANPQIIEVAPNSYVMAYNGRGNDALGAWRVGFASSTDLVNWYRNPGNPVIKPGTAQFDAGYVETSFLAKADSYGVAKLYVQGYDILGSPQVGLATADWREFSALFMGNDGLQYARRLDGTLLRATLPSTGQGYWDQLGAGWNQFSIIFSGALAGEDWIYAVRSSDGAFLRNRYVNGQWQDWEQIGAGWDQFTKIFIGIDGWIYTIDSVGALRRNKYINGTWQGWVEIGAGWNSFTHAFMGTDGWIYAVLSDQLIKNYHTGSGWSGWVQIGAGWDQFTHVFPGSDNWIHAMRSDGYLLKNKYVDGVGWQGWQEL